MENTTQRPRSWLRILEVATMVAVLATSVAVLWEVVATRWVKPRVVATSPLPPVQQPLPKEPVSLQGLPVMGKPTAPIALIGYSDFECPYCRKFSEQTLPRIVTEFVEPGTVLFAFASLPLERLHRSAFRAAEVAECAIQQDRFWPTHDWLFRIDYASPINWVQGARQVGLDEEDLRRCLEVVGPKVRQSVADAAALQITGTPTFLAGTMLPGGKVMVIERMAGAQPFENFVRLFERLRSVSE